MPVSIPTSALGGTESAAATESLLANQEQDKPIANGTFWVKQTHLGFCPADVMLQVRPRSIALLNDDYVVVEYKFQNLILWTQSRASITLMLQSNLKRLVLQARNRMAARKIVVLLHDATQTLQNELERRSAFWGVTSEDLEGSNMFESEIWMPTQSGLFESADSELEALDSFKTFRVKQMHRQDKPASVMLRIGKDGLRLISGTGETIWSCEWSKILMWRADDAAVMLVFTESNRQMELLSAASHDISAAMTAKAQAVGNSLRGETHTRQSFGRSQKLPKAPLEFRRQMLTFEAPAVRPNEKWRDGGSGIRRLLSLRNEQNMLESVKAREQLHAVFNLADTDGSGALDAGEIAALLRSLNIFNDDGTEFKKAEIQLMMVDMDAFADEVTFDGFVAWALSSSTGARATTLLKSRVDHRKKEVEAIGQIFDQLDQDGDGMMDRADFKDLLHHVGISLNDHESYQLWGLLDRDRSGEIDFQEFFSWYKRYTVDQVTQQLQRSLRLTRLLQNAKGAMVYAVDRGNLRSKESLRKLFDSVEQVGTNKISKDDLMAVVEDLRIEADEYDVIMAMREIDVDGNGIDLKSWTSWWCSDPSSTASGTLRSKMKLAAFTAKTSGPLLQVVGTTDEGAADAEVYLNELLQAAFAQKKELRGNTLGVFGERNHFRLWCSHLIQNPLTDRLLVVAIFGNVALMAAQTPGEESTVGLAVVNMCLMIIFTAEMGMRIVANGLLFGETAYLSNSWDTFDFFIINAVWAIYAASLFLDVDKNVGFGLAMLRSFRALRFFSHIRNILASIIAGKVMIGSVLLLLLFLFMLIYVIGFQLFAGVMDTACHASRDRCAECGEIVECPATLECSKDLDCYSLSLFNETIQNATFSTVPKFGFDTFGTSMLTVGSIITFDGWFDVSVPMRGSHVAMRDWAWPAFASAAVGIGLFTVNLFVAGLAYSFIKIRKTSRNLDAQGSMKKSLVERMLNDKVNSGSIEESSRHMLQLLNPAATRTARRWLQSSWFLNSILITVLINVGFMTADHHNPSEQTVQAFTIAEAIFTAIYSFEMLVKMQAMGFRRYFSVSLNRLDFVIVTASLSSYWLMLFRDDTSNAKGSAVLRLLRVTKVVRAARIAKIIFRSESVRGVFAKAFAGLDAIFSLLMFIFFLLTLAAIAGRELFHTCSNDAEPTLSHAPNFDTFWQSFLISWQVMTLDSWTGIMLTHIECAGNVAAVYFAFIAGTCTFVLGNLFVAIFMENFEIGDQEKRDMQVGIYMQMLAQDRATEGDTKGWVSGIQKGIRGVEDMLTETSTISVLRRRTVDEFLRGAKLTKNAGSYIGKRGISRIKPIARQVDRCSNWWQDCRKRQSRAMSSNGGELSPKASYLSGQFQSRSQHSSSERQFWIDVAGSKAFHRFMLLTLIVCLLDTVMSSESSGMSTMQHNLYMAAKVFVAITFVLESLIKLFAYRLLGDIDPTVWPSPTTTWELFMAVLHILALLNVPYVTTVLPLRVFRIVYMVKRLRLMFEAFLRSLSAVWTALVLMAASFLAFGIVGMNLYAGLLWHCVEALDLDRNDCEAAGLTWENRPFHFDNIVGSSIAMFSVWSLQGWTTLWYWAMDATEVDFAPEKDSGTVSAFVFFASFIMWNSLMLTNLFTSMLCDYFAQSSGSLLMTSEQRNWQFMSMFLVDSLRLEVIPPPDPDRWFGLASIGFNVVHAKSFKALVDLTIVASVVSMVGQQSMLSLDPTGFVGEVLLLLDEFALVVFTLEAIFTLGGLGGKIYFRDFQMEAIVCGTMWTTTVLLYLKVYSGVEVLPQLQAITFIRAMRLITVVKRVHAIKKIHYLVMIALPQVVNLCCIMVVVFVVFAAYATMLCGGIPHTSSVTEFDNFDTVRASFRVLFQLCTGMSMVGINYECAEVRGKSVLLFFMGFFFFANMLLVNLFIALLLDNFDLMGSEDMAVSDMDIRLFKRRWVRYAGGKNGEKHRQTIHDSIGLAQVQRFVNQPGMGTFSMMPQADPFYFNRVIFELHPQDGKHGDYTRQDVLDCQDGRQEIRVFFFDLLLALCHIRFSSSCLTLANEVTKSALLVEQHENHAARILQVGARAFVTRQTMNVYGERCAPGFLWTSENATGENPMQESRLVQGKDYAHGPTGRCGICTLPKPWCECQEKRKAQKEREDKQRKVDRALMSGDREALVLLKSSDMSIDLTTHDDEQDIDQSVFQEIKSKPKHAWDCAVNVAMFLTLRSLINVDRITPEHVVSDAFDQLQSVVDKSNEKRGTLAKLWRRQESDDFAEDAVDDRKSSTSPTRVATPDSIMHEMRKLAKMDLEDVLAAFRMHDHFESGCVSPNDFRAVLEYLGLHLSPEELRAIDGILDKEEDGTIDYEDFLGSLDGGRMAVLEAKLVEQTGMDIDAGTKRKNRTKRQRRKKEKAGKTVHAADLVVFSNPIDPGAPADQQTHVQQRASEGTEDGPGNQLKIMNPLAAALSSLDDDDVSSRKPMDSVAGDGLLDDDMFSSTDDIDFSTSKAVPLRQTKEKKSTSMLDSVDMVESGEQRKVKMKKRPSVYRYKVLNIGRLRTAMAPNSPELAGQLSVGEVIVADEREQLIGAVGVRINGTQFGAEYAYTNVTAPDGTVLLEFIHDDAVSFVFRVLQKTWLTKQLEYSEAYATQSKIYAKTNHSQKLKPGDTVEVHSYQSVGGVTRLKVHDNRGWTTLVSEDGVQLLEARRPLDMLRLHLHSLTLRQLRTEAVKTYQVDSATVDQASSETHEVDPNGVVIALCLNNWKLSTRGTDFLETLLHNADGLFEELSIHDRVTVHASDDRGTQSLHGKLGRVTSIKQRANGSKVVEILIDGERATRTFDASQVKKCVDEAVPTSLFAAVLADDKETLAQLIASKVAPSDAVFGDHTPIPAGHLRVAQATNSEGQTLYDVATSKRKKRCAEYLACRLMFQAVVDDDDEALQHLLHGAGVLDSICPDGAFPEEGTIATADGSHVYPRSPQAGEPLIERARRVWECNGAPDTLESAKLLGGCCWFLLSERWEDRFGMVYSPHKVQASLPTDALAIGTRSLVTAKRMRKKLEEAKDVRASEAELQATLHWKERNAFMTRKTGISS